MNGIIDFLLITIVTIIIGGVLVLLFKALERYLSTYFQLTFYYNFLSFAILLHIFPFVFILLRLYYHIMIHPVTALFGMATSGMTIIFSILAVVWMVGIVVHFVLQLDGIRLLSRISKEHTLVPQYYHKILGELCKEMGIRRHISIYCSYHSGTVFITGLIKPTIYVPVEQIDASFLRVILMHELRHYKQGDVLVKPICAILRLVFWFWPPFKYIADNYGIYAEANNDNYCINKLEGDGKQYFYMLVDFSDMGYRLKNVITSAWVEESNDIVRRAAIVNTYTAKKTKISMAAMFIAFTLAVCSVTAYGAKNTIQYGYNQMWHETMVGEEEQPDVIPELEEYEGSVDDFKGMTEVEGDQVDIAPLAGGNFISCTLMNQSYYRSPVISKSKGGTIEVTVSVKPTDKEVTVGIIKPGGTTTYVKGKKTIAHTFSCPTTGNYQVFISNYSGAQVSITGYYY